MSLVFTPRPAGGASPATPSTPGTVALAGDLAGSSAAPTVLRSRPAFAHQKLWFDAIASTPAVRMSDLTGMTFGLGLYWPSIIDMRGKVKNPIDNFYLYLSTNHDSSNGGGVWLLTAPTPAGPWTPYSPNRIWHRPTQNVHESEPFQFVWDPDTKQFFVYYGDFGGGNQGTFVAISKDGLTFENTDIQLIFTTGTQSQPGNRHTGYFKPTRLGTGQWISESIAGGGHHAVWRSRDGLRWHMDPNLTCTNAESSLTPIRTVYARGIFILEGRPWALHQETFWNAGGGAYTYTRMFAGPVSFDHRRMMTAEKCWEPVHPWENANIQSQTVFVDTDGTVYLFYICGTDMGIAKGRFI